MNENQRKPQKAAAVGKSEKHTRKKGFDEVKVLHRTTKLTDERNKQTERLKKLQAEYREASERLSALNATQASLHEIVKKASEEERKLIIQQINELQPEIRELGKLMPRLVEEMKETNALTEQQERVYLNDLLQVSTWMGPPGELTMGEEEEEAILTKEELKQLLHLNQAKDDKIRILTNVILINDKLMAFAPQSLKKDIQALYDICRETFNAYDNQPLLFTTDGKYRLFSHGVLHTAETTPDGITGHEAKVAITPHLFTQNMNTLRSVGQELETMNKVAVQWDDELLAGVYEHMTAHWHNNMDALLELRRIDLQEQIRQEFALTKLDQLHWEVQTITRQQEMVMGQQAQGYREDMSNAVSMMQTYVGDFGVTMGRAVAQLVSSSENRIMAYVSRELSSMHAKNLNQFRSTVQEIFRLRDNADKKERLQLREDLIAAILKIKDDFPQLPPPLQKEQIEEWAGALILREKGELVKVVNELEAKQEMAVQLAPMSEELAKIRDAHTARLHSLEEVFRGMATNIGTLVGKMEGVETSLATQGKTIGELATEMTTDYEKLRSVSEEINKQTDAEKRLAIIRARKLTLTERLYLYSKYQMYVSMHVHEDDIKKLQTNITKALSGKPDVAELLKEQTKLIQDLVGRPPVTVMAPTRDQPSTSSATETVYRPSETTKYEEPEEMHMDTPRPAEPPPRVVPTQPAQPMQLDEAAVLAEYTDQKDTRVSELQRHRLNVPKFRAEVFGDIRNAVIDEGLYRPANRARQAFGIYNRALDLAEKTPFVAKYNFVRA
jgi:hypothetical protein